MTPQQRQTRARMGGLAYRAKYGSDQIALVGQRALLAKFEEQADPDGRLSPRERERRGEKLYRLHMTRLSAKAAESRRKKKASR